MSEYAEKRGKNRPFSAQNAQFLRENVQFERAVFAHGFAVLSDTAVFQYKCDNYYAPLADGGIAITDPSLGIDWHIDPTEAILSDKDTRHPLLKDFDTPFEYGEY
ncbi:MAG: dTDP-4-dehydrorhamnose 3,5-epimerase [Treponemataceae bacterium]|nr:dTDP-4-dehydrorhamnose 3,5-epimerase [Treponemataceae bacterium]